MKTANSKIAVMLLPVLLLLVPGCASSDKKSSGDDIGKSSGGGGGGGGGGADKADAPSASASRVLLTQSLSNNPLTSQTVNTGKADALAGRYNGAKDKVSLESKLSAERLARKGTGQVMATGKKIAELEMQRGAGRTVSEDVKLEIALAAIAAKNYSLAEYYLQALTDSKDARARAGAYNALGVIAVRDDRVPEAVLYFREALKANGSYKPALLNLGLTALKGGDLDTAKKALSDLQNDWFVQYAFISIARLEGNESRAAELCEKVLGKESGHKAALFNCGLLEYQNKNNFAKAKEFFSKASKARGGESDWDNRAAVLVTQIEFEEAAKKSADAKKKAGAKPQAQPASGGGPGG